MPEAWDWMYVSLRKLKMQIHNNPSGWFCKLKSRDSTENKQTARLWLAVHFTGAWEATTVNTTSSQSSTRQRADGNSTSLRTERVRYSVSGTIVYKYTMMYQSNTTKPYYACYCIMATCFDSYRFIFRPFWDTDPYLKLRHPRCVCNN